MSSFDSIFEETRKNAQVIIRSWRVFIDGMLKSFPEVYQSELKDLDEDFQVAIGQLFNDLQHPILTLAVSGTTSSGKSTLVNLMCGAELMPVAVYEMTACAVTIKYSEKKLLEIRDTHGSLREWNDVEDEEIYQRLDSAMKHYIGLRENRASVSRPTATVYYPLKLQSYLRSLASTEATVQIIDLPGLSYVGDEDTLKVIRSCQDALCLLTFNSAETDPKKVQDLLSEIVKTVRDLRGSPARMLFIINRIDIFRSDKFWPKTENTFVERITENIKEELIQKLPEHCEEIESINAVRLSALPALLALQIQEDNSDSSSFKACNRADNYFHFLINEEILDDLPRKTERWSVSQRNQVAEELWKNSYANEFYQHLDKHIAQHFPNLVIPQIINKFRDKLICDSVEWAQQFKQTASLRGNYDDECEIIETILKEIDGFVEESQIKLKQNLST